MSLKEAMKGASKTYTKKAKAPKAPSKRGIYKVKSKPSAMEQEATEAKAKAQMTL